MSTIAVHVDHIGKRYRIGVSRDVIRQYRSIHSAIAWRLRYLRQCIVHAVRRQPPPELAQAPDILWALQDISLDIHQGETVALIGKNGSGKSTLLKILSRITEPTTGSADLYGRVGSMLEVGTGFHPELTGRENIYLNGAILGMTKAEIAKKFDAIVAFSEIERFLDTPVKRFSSGMYVRLAFAVAAHLEPEILLVDEVLAVGDSAFQQKCLTKMRDIAQDGRTVIFVSHDLQAVRSFCTRGIVFAEGAITFDGPIEQAIAHYMPISGTLTGDGTVPAAYPRTIGTHEGLFRSVLLIDAGSRACAIVPFGSPLTLTVSFTVTAPIADAVMEIGLTTSDKIRVATLSSLPAVGPTALMPGEWTITVNTDTHLMPGRYLIDLRLSHQESGAVIDQIDHALIMDIEPTRQSDHSDESRLTTSGMGFIQLPATWQPPLPDRTPHQQSVSSE